MAFSWNDIDVLVQPALDRLDLYNSAPFNAGSNPRGMGAGGHITQFPQATDDLSKFGNALPEFADLMETRANAADASATAAAASAAKLQATSTTSVTLSTGNKSFTTQSGKQIVVGDTLLVSSDANPTTHWMVIRVTSYSGTALQGDVLSFAGSGSRSDWTIRHSGVPGVVPALLYKFSTDTNNSDPTTGTLKINHATPSSASSLFISETDFFGSDLSAILARWGVSTSAIKGRLEIVSLTEPTKRLDLEVTSARTDNGTWDSFTIANAVGALPTNGGLVAVMFAHSGDTGATGSTGATGNTGAAGDDAGLEYLFNTATAGDPTTGKFRFNHATFGSATVVAIHETDNNANALASLFTALDNSTSANKAAVLAIKAGGAALFSFYITSVLTDQGNYVEFNITPITSSGSIALNDIVHLQFFVLGDKGDTGNTGAQGNTGPAGPSTAPTWLFDSGTTDADPGANEFRFNNATIGSVTKAFVNDQGVGAADLTAFIASWDDSTNSTHRGTLTFVQANDPSKYAIFTVGTVTDDGSYFDVALTYVAGPGGFEVGAACAIAFTRSGNAGAGSGDVVGPASATNNNLALFDGGTGKLIKDSLVTIDDIVGRTTVRAATTGNITIATALNNADTLDGVTLATGDLVLVKDQSSPQENGIYVVGVSPARSTQFDTYNEHPGVLVAVQEGSVNADSLWLCTSNKGGTINSTALAFSQQAGPSTAAGRSLLAAADAAAQKTLLSLENVTNTSDANKPVSTAQRAAVNRVRVRVATTANITIATDLNNGDTIDGVVLADGDMVLVKDQSSPADNGVYMVAGSPARATEFAAYNDHPGTYLAVEEGTANADTTWLCTSNRGGTIGATALAFSQQGGPSTTVGRSLLNASTALAAFDAIKQSATESATGVVELATVNEAGTGTDANRAVTPAGLFPAFTDIASAATTDLGTVTSSKVRITGTTTITAFGTIAAGITKYIRFAGALTLTHNATSLILPGAANITTAADDAAIAISLGSGNWIVVAYLRASGLPVIIATTAQYLANTAGRALTTDQVNAAGALFGLTDGATINWDMASGFNASVTLGGNRTLANPTNTIVGRTGAIVVTQDGTGSRTLAYGTNWEAAGGVFPVLSTAAGAKDVIFYWIQSSTSIIITGILKGLV